MKRLFTIGAILFLLVMLVGCRQYDAAANEASVADSVEEESHSAYYPDEEEHEGCHHFHEEEHEVHAYEQEDSTRIEASWVVDQMWFSSIEDFLNAYVTTDAGGEIDHLESEWQAQFGRGEHITFAESAAKVNFTSLEHVYLPVGIPDELELFSIMVNEGVVEFTFMHPEDMISDDAVWDAYRNFRELRFGFRRWDEDDSVLFDILMEQSREHGALIDGKYLFIEDEWVGHTFDWVSNRTRFWLQLPAGRNAAGERVESERGGVSLDDPHAMLSFTETVTLNLQDTHAVETMIEELEAAKR